MSVREPAVAGTFYPSTAKDIKALVQRILEKESGEINYSLAEKKIAGAVVPHAGYIYSGYEAIHAFEIIRASGQVFDTVIILNPNHHRLGPGIAADANDFWETPLGRVPIDVEMTDALELPKAMESHRHEHSGEVLLPLIQLFFPAGVRIIPISMFNQDPEHAFSLAQNISRSVNRFHRRVLVLASSDFSHFISPEIGTKNDREVIGAILSMQPEAVYRKIRQNNASVCGYGPIMTLMHFTLMNYRQPEAALLKFGNSGKTVPSDSVVDYASVLFYT